MNRTIEAIQELVNFQLNRIRDERVRSAIQSILVTPSCHYRDWDYGKEGEQYPCWIVAVHSSSKTAIVFSDYGFGPERPWGLIYLSDNWFGMDSEWFKNLDQVFLSSPAWKHSNISEQQCSQLNPDVYKASRATEPQYIQIDPDDDCAMYVGRTVDGLQFFLTTPFIPQSHTDERGCEFVALYIFNKQGVLIEAKIDNLGPREQLNSALAEVVTKRYLKEIGDYRVQSITIRPFEVYQYGVTFGFIIHPPRNKGEEWYVTVEPGNYMSFHEPWNSGLYDT